MTASLLRQCAGLGLLLLSGIAPIRLSGQKPDANSRLATRAELESQAQTLERSASSPAYGARLRATAVADLAAIRRRLSAGDFRVGQQILLRIDGAAAPINDTLTVLDSLILDLPGIRRVSLFGLLRSELEARLTLEVGQVVRNARVSARPLMRLAVLGAVGAPGFSSVPHETLVDQLLTLGGGPADRATIDDLRLMRGDTILLRGDAVMSAIADGQTVAALGLRDGDALFVPRGSEPLNRTSALSLVTLFLSPLLTIFVFR